MFRRLSVLTLHLCSKGIVGLRDIEGLFKVLVHAILLASWILLQ